MSKRTNAQRFERYEIPYAIYSTVRSEEYPDTFVWQVTGVYYNTVFENEEWTKKREFLDLGQHSTRDLAFETGMKYKADPESYYEEHLRKLEAQNKENEHEHGHEHHHEHDHAA